MLSPNMRIQLNNPESAVMDCKRKLDISPQDKIYFKDEDQNEFPLVYQIYNEIMEPYGFNTYSEYGFESIAGGSSTSMNLIDNYAEGYGRIKNGYTRLIDIVNYCYQIYQSSILIPPNRIKEELEWAIEAIENDCISLHSGGHKQRYFWEACFDIVKGNLAEVAFQIDLENKFNIESERDNNLYEGQFNTDNGSDIKSVKHPESDQWACPNSKIQVKDIKNFLLVSKSEFDSDRCADIFVAYDTQWNNNRTGRDLLKYYYDKNESFSGIRVIPYGWGKKEDFKFLESGERCMGESFESDNMYIHREDLASIDEEICSFISS